MTQGVDSDLCADDKRLKRALKSLLTHQACSNDEWTGSCSNLGLGSNEERLITAGNKGELRDSGRRYTSASVRVAQKATVAATSRAARRAGVGGEVTLGTRPDAAGSPVVGNGEGGRGTRSHLPARRLGRDSRASVKVREETGPVEGSAGAPALQSG